MKKIQEIRNCFIPSEQNKHQSYILRPKALATYSAILIFIKVAVSVLFIFYPNLAYLSDVTPDKLISLTNQTRQAQGLNPLIVNSKLTAAAKNKASDMLEKDYFAHTSPEGATPWKWIKEAGYSYIYAGENLAMDFVSAEAIHNAWMTSDTHKANILNPNYKEAGIVVLHGEFQGKSTCLVVQMFGSTNPVGGSLTPAEETQATAQVTQPVPATPKQALTPEKIMPKETQKPPLDTTPPESQFATDTQPPIIDINNSYIIFNKEKKQLDVFIYVQGDPKKVLASSNTNQIELNNNFGLWTGSINLKDGIPASCKIEARDAAGNAIEIPLPTQGKIQSAFIGPANQPAQNLSLKANQISKKIYLGALAFLICALALNILIKIKIQHPKTLVFSLLLCGMTILLLLI